MQSELMRPIVGIENRTAQEVFDIMCDRFRSALSAEVQDVAIPVAKIVEAKTPAAQQIYGFDIRFFDALRGLPIGTKLYAAVPQGTSDVKQMGGGR